MPSGKGDVNLGSVIYVGLLGCNRSLWENTNGLEENNTSIFRAEVQYMWMSRFYAPIMRSFYALRIKKASL
jgi:hypothetical protein